MDSSTFVCSVLKFFSSHCWSMRLVTKPVNWSSIISMRTSSASLDFCLRSRRYAQVGTRKCTTIQKLSRTDWIVRMTTLVRRALGGRRYTGQRSRLSRSTCGQEEGKGVDIDNNRVSRLGDCRGTTPYKTGACNRTACTTTAVYDERAKEGPEKTRLQSWQHSVDRGHSSSESLSATLLVRGGER